ncbi:RagB/SusD family nutrient uptake outer membrane protein [Flavobacterium cheongpyeongense]|uniref:RagB/SusD family nutrient uptake outer membrane protein n=1 Tax=Flavobacterium cheongpyeongense TaxID=2212651 RepID=A0A2V4BU56_9FLAO|nr:RagB/SusD family nutrient uptake outer membrane protein [Flavobacterium cheongpyeongense]PXY42177.1 RagB/SusD family nutrient uptake outer membrane protein [Flavobacterium cheongpyeongense]
MKKILKYLGLPVLMVGLFWSCEDLDVPITTQLTPEVFPQNSTQYIQTTGPVYSAFRGEFSFSWWWSQSLTTDEAILPARGGNWFDNRNYIAMHFHDWTADNGIIGSLWDWSSKVIGISNQTISILNQAMPAGEEKNTLISEVKTMRAISYYMLMDSYGDVPLDTVYGDFSSRAKSSRTEVFNFIEKELKKAIPNLNAASGVTTYGRPNKQTANALLAKLYLNAQVYTGTQRYNDCIAACDQVISSGLYNIESRATYLQMFYPTNGPQMKEFIFAVPYDPSAVTVGFNGQMYHARYDVPRSERAKFGLPFTPSAPRSTLPEFYANFDDANDIRNRQWLTGLQYMNDGVTPVRVTTTKKGYDQFYTGSDGGAALTYQVDLTPNIVPRQNLTLFDLGNDEIAWNMGYRNIKFYPDNTSTNRNQNNDVPFLRYSDVLLMKAEAILRGGNETLGQTAISLVNMVRSNRTTSTAWSSVTLEELYKERCREFAWEAWHRNDMIRFGKYEGQWGYKTNTDTYRRVFPIPTNAMVLNPALTQNEGYPN